MKRTAQLMVIFFASVLLALAYAVTCPMHTYASCYNTGEIGGTGQAHKYHCTCGDDVWVH